MRILIVGPFPPYRGGIAQHTSQTARALEALGHDVERVSWRSMYPSRLYKGGEQRDPGERTDIECLQWWNPLTWLQVGRRARQADLVLMPWVVPVHAPIQASIERLRGGAKLAFIVHNPTPHEPFPFAEQAAKAVLRRGDVLVAHAEHVAEELTALGINVPVRITAHPPNIDVEPTQPPSHPPFRFAAIGHLRTYKGTDLAIQTVGALASGGMDVELTVAGQPWDDTDWTAMAEHHGLGERFTLVDRYLSDDEVAQLLHDSHALIAPYRSATQSGIIALALSSGRPVICTDVGGLSDLVTHGINGIVVEPEDNMALEKGARDLISEHTRLAAGARESGASWRAVAEAIVAPVEP